MIIDHDRLFKELLMTFFEEFLNLFVPEAIALGAPSSITFLRTEIFRDMPGQERREPDIVAQVEFAGGKKALYLIHVEIQSQHQTEFARRMFFYFSRLHEAYSGPIYPIALFTYDEGQNKELNRYVMNFPGLSVLDFRFVGIKLQELDWRKYLRHRNPVATALMAKMGYRPEEKPRLKAECLRQLLFLRLPEEEEALIGEFIHTYLTLDEKEERQYNQIIGGFSMAEKQALMKRRTWWDRALAQGLERGIEQGMERGIERGRVEALREMLLLQLEQRFGSVPEEDRTRIEALSATMLRELIVHFAKAHTYEEWRGELLRLADSLTAPSKPSSDG